MEGEGHIWLCNATTTQIVDELESRDTAAVLITVDPDGVSTLIALQEETLTEELAAELNAVSPKVQFTQHIEKHELRQFLISVLLGIQEERKPRRRRRLRE